MATVAGTTTIPIAIGLLVAVALFLAWAAQVARSQGAESAPPRAAPVRQPTSVQVVIGPHFTVAAPDDAAVHAAMSHRVRPPTPLPSPARTTPTHEEPAAAMPLTRSA
jgi:hypothetical protein